MSERFLSKQRIRNMTQFKRVYSLRQRFPGRFYVLYYGSNQEHYPRLGVVASNRNVRKAVVRSQVKRLAREAFRYHQQQLHDFDVVIVAKADASEADKRDLRLCLDKLFTRLTRLSES